MTLLKIFSLFILLLEFLRPSFTKNYRNNVYNDDYYEFDNYDKYEFDYYDNYDDNNDYEYEYIDDGAYQDIELNNAMMPTPPSNKSKCFTRVIPPNYPWVPYPFSLTIIEWTLILCKFRRRNSELECISRYSEFFQ